MAAPYDYVELIAPAGEWPAGTRRHLVEAYPNGTGLVEVDGGGAGDPARGFLPAVRLEALGVLEPAASRL
jgi:hypothetical protein